MADRERVWVPYIPYQCGLTPSPTRGRVFDLGRKESMTYCDNCGEPYEADDSGSHCCPKCRIRLPGQTDFTEDWKAKALGMGTELERLREQLRVAEEARDAYQAALHDNYQALRAENDHFRRSLNNMVLLKDEDGFEVKHVCALCGCELHVEVEPVRTCMWCKRIREHQKDPKVKAAPPHIHIRCNACSPKLWWGCVAIKEKT